MAKESTYHLGLLRGSSHRNLWGNGHRDGTLVIQVCRSVDFLSCDLWEYIGERVITKAYLRRHCGDLLAAINQQYGTAFKRLVVE